MPWALSARSSQGIGPWRIYAIAEERVGPKRSVPADCLCTDRAQRRRIEPCPSWDCRCRGHDNVDQSGAHVRQITMPIYGSFGRIRRAIPRCRRQSKTETLDASGVRRRRRNRSPRPSQVARRGQGLRDRSRAAMTPSTSRRAAGKIADKRRQHQFQRSRFPCAVISGLRRRPSLPTFDPARSSRNGWRTSCANRRRAGTDPIIVAAEQATTSQTTRYPALFWLDPSLITLKH